MENSRLSVRLERGPFLEILERTITAIGKKHPTLSSFHLVVSEREIRAEATDLEISLVDFCGVLETETPGRILVPAAAFRDLVKKAPSDELELQELDNFRLEIRSGEGLFRLAGLDPVGFPELPEPGGELCRVWAEDLQGLLSAIAHAQCTDPVKVNLHGVRLQWKENAAGGVLTGVAVGGHRLALAGKRLEDPAPLFAGGVLVPRKGADAIKKLSGELNLSLAGGAIHATQGNLRLSIRLLEDNFPDHRKVIPQNHPATISVDRDLLSEAVDRVALLAADSAVGLDLQGGVMVLKSESVRGDALETVEINSDQEIPLELRLNARYLLDALGSLGAGEVFIKYQDGTEPILLLPGDLSGFDERVLVLMPRRS